MGWIVHSCCEQGMTNPAQAYFTVPDSFNRKYNEIECECPEALAALDK